MPIKFKTNKSRNFKRLVIGGEPSIGKTTAVFNMYKSPGIFDLDGRIPDAFLENAQIFDCKPSYKGIKAQLKELLAEESLPLDAIVFDTATQLEDKSRLYSIDTDYGGKEDNYTAYSQGDKQNLPIHFKKLLDLCDQVSEKHDVDIVFLCHSTVKPQKNPIGESFDRYTLDLVDKVRGRLIQWADYVGFAWNDIETEKVGLKVKAKNGTRKISFRLNPCWDAKGPAEIDKDFPFDEKGEWYNNLKKENK